MLVLAVLSLSLAPNAVMRPVTRPLSTGYAGLRPDWVRLPLPSPTPPAALRVAPVATPEPSPIVETPPPPTVEAPPPTETIAIAGIAAPMEVPPSATAAPTETPVPPAPSPSPTSAPVLTEGLDVAYAERIVDLINEARVANGLSPLAQHPALVASAQKYADLHAHVSPERLDHDLGGSTLGSRIAAEGYTGWTFLAENLLWVSFEPPLSPAESVQQWLASPAHRDNILNPTVNETGVGCYVSFVEPAYRICVQDFGARP